MYPNCPIKDNFDEEKSKSTGNHYNSSFLINNGYLKKDELLDVDGKSYCVFMLLFNQPLKTHKIIKIIVQ